MNKLIHIGITMLLVLSGLTTSVRAEVVTIDEARKVAENWITTIIHFEGNWGNYQSAELKNIHELRRENRILGYYCSVDPEGYIIISIYKALAPVKLYSVSGKPDMINGYDIIEFIKNDMEQTLDAVEKELGPIASVKMEDVREILKTNQSNAWNELTRDIPSFTTVLKSETTLMEYETGTRLLNTEWNQDWPYNKECPDLNCTNDPDLNGYAWVGCAATAAAQIMRYWSWPPEEYDWLNMPNSIDDNSPDNEKDAIAILSHDAGTASGMNYGCDESWIFPNLPMKNALVNNFKYNADHELGTFIDLITLIPIPYDIESWQNLQKDQLNAYRPLLYGNGGMQHTYIVDGWKEIYNTYWHLNMGWGGTENGWWTRDYIPVTDDMVRDIEPIQSLDPGLLMSVYDKLPFNYRYFTQDNTSMTDAEFASGQNLQFLPGIILRTNPGTSIRFEGNPYSTRLFSIKSTQLAEIKIHHDGAIKLQNGGGITFLSRQQYSD